MARKRLRNRVVNTLDKNYAPEVLFAGSTLAGTTGLLRAKRYQKELFLGYARSLKRVRPKTNISGAKSIWRKSAKVRSSPVLRLYPGYVSSKVKKALGNNSGKINALKKHKWKTFRKISKKRLPVLAGLGIAGVGSWATSQYLTQKSTRQESFLRNFSENALALGAGVGGAFALRKLAWARKLKLKKRPKLRRR